MFGLLLLAVKKSRKRKAAASPRPETARARRERGAESLTMVAGLAEIFAGGSTLSGLPYVPTCLAILIAVQFPLDDVA